MNATITCVRIFYALLSIFFMITYMEMSVNNEYSVLYGIATGVLITVGLIGLDMTIKKYNLKLFNTLLLGLFLGYLMGYILSSFLDAILFALTVPLKSTVLQLLRAFLYLTGAYFGITFMFRSSQEISLSIPFVKINAHNIKKKDLLLDISVLCDTRIVDLCLSGILDHSLIIPDFVVKELNLHAESAEEMIKNRAKKGIEALKKLESLPELSLRRDETNFSEINEMQAKLVRLARLLDANILTADSHRVQIHAIDGVKIVNIHMLSNSLKPMTQTGELIKVKIQRFGKEPRQGIGYLEDGTMVVVNGGGDHIAETIVVRVLSVKHSTSGRMVFCNTLEEDSCIKEENRLIQEVENTSCAQL